MNKNAIVFPTPAFNSGGCQECRISRKDPIMCRVLQYFLKEEKTRETQKRGTSESSQERNAEHGDFIPMGLECKYCAQV